MRKNFHVPHGYFTSSAPHCHRVITDSSRILSACPDSRCLDSGSATPTHNPQKVLHPDRGEDTHIELARIVLSPVAG
ncbi:hypothetical protein E2C01_034880 [Portunus trituberculatus]|uniref:Uncharacterized protein n=1 Tax=Portunus trituberculatus TaxID=210409 RepID=A0A5B7F409_PORTR|nr:hypothetical protein [Portunus trituberculatus]